MTAAVIELTKDVQHATNVNLYSRNSHKPERTMGKIPKFEIVPPPDRLEYMMGIWERYIKNGGRVGRGYPSKACGFSGAGSTSIEDMQEENDLYIARAVDAVVNDLPDEECSAIHHEYLDSRYRGLIVFYAPTLRRAKAMIQAGIERRGIW